MKYDEINILKHLQFDRSKCFNILIWRVLLCVDCKTAMKYFYFITEFIRQ